MIEDLKVISELYPDTFKFIFISSYLLGFFCPFVDFLICKFFSKFKKKKGESEEKIQR